MLLSIVEGLIELKSRKYAGHGDICSDNVYYCTNRKQFKLKHPYLCKSAYLYVYQQERFKPLSPEQLLALSEDSSHGEITEKSDIFALGLLGLEVSTLLPTC